MLIGILPQWLGVILILIAVAIAKGVRSDDPEVQQRAWIVIILLFGTALAFTRI